VPKISECTFEEFREIYINEQFNKAIHVWKAGKETGGVEVHSQISQRLVKLPESNFLQEIKYASYKNGVFIFSGILSELYSRGVTRDQFAGLKDLKDYIGSLAEYTKYNGKKAIFADENTLSQYFDQYI
jgi:hypothetical protein